MTSRKNYHLQVASLERTNVTNVCVCKAKQNECNSNEFIGFLVSSVGLSAVILLDQWSTEMEPHWLLLFKKGPDPREEREPAVLPPPSYA